MSPKDIEDAIISKLAASAADLVYTVGKFNGRGDQYGEEFWDWIGQAECPLIAVFYAGGDPDTGQVDDSLTVCKMYAEFEIWIIHDQLRSYDEAMNDTKGIHAILNKVFQSLQGLIPVPGAQPLNQFSERPAFSLPDRFVWIQKYATVYRRS